MLQWLESFLGTYLSEKVTILKHFARNALIPVVRYGSPSQRTKAGTFSVRMTHSWSTGAFPKRVAKRRAAAPTGKSKRLSPAAGPRAARGSACHAQSGPERLKSETPHVASRDPPRGTAP